MTTRPTLTLGTRMQRCPVCDETFSSEHIADRHRYIASTYDAFRRDGSLASVGNERRACLTPEQMLARRTKAGEPVFRLDERGVWHSGRRREMPQEAAPSSRRGTNTPAPVLGGTPHLESASDSRLAGEDR